MKFGVLFSGGKDSTYAAWLASQRGQLACLITMLPKSESSYMFHFPNAKWTKLQAEAAGVPHVAHFTEGVKEEELRDLREALTLAKNRFGIDGVYTGALASFYQKSRVEGVCEGLGLACLSPLWGTNQEEHLARLVRDGFVAMIVSVSALGLGKDWLGRVIDSQAAAELSRLGRKYGFNAALEGGEGETFVLDSPLFEKRIEVTKSEKRWDGESGMLLIKRACTVPKA